MAIERIIDLRKASVADRPKLSVSLDPRSIAFITPVADAMQYRVCLRYLDKLAIPSGYLVERIAVVGGSSMAEKYQAAMLASSARYKIYLHVDTYLVHRGMLDELLGIFRMYPRLGLVGTFGIDQLPAAGINWVASHCYGQYWENIRKANSMPGIPLWPPDYFWRRKLIRALSFVGNYLPAVVVDGFFMATQYDLPWQNPLGPFDVVNDLYDHVQSLEFIKAGLEVGVAQQQITWCLHWGPLKKRSRREARENVNWRRQQLLSRAAIFRQLYSDFLGVPTKRLYEQYRAFSAHNNSSGLDEGV